MTKTSDNFLRVKRNAISVAFHPGTKKTEFSVQAPSAEEVLSEDEAVEKTMKVLTTMLADQARGRCWDYKNEEVVALETVMACDHSSFVYVSSIWSRNMHGEIVAGGDSV